MQHKTISAFFLFLLTILLLNVSSPARASNDFALGVGWFNFTHDNDDSVNFAGELRANPFFYGLRPVLGLQVNTDSGVYGYGGFDYDWEFYPHWVITPGVDVGLYHQGGSIDLGGPVEFHESLELGYKFDVGRLGIQISHTSNADIYANNPGENELMAFFSIPLQLQR